MSMSKMIKAAGMSAAIASSASVSAQNTMTIPAVTPNVPYDQVLAAPFRSADRRIEYGEDALQFGLLWEAQSANLKDTSPKSGSNELISELNNAPSDTAESERPLVIFIHGGCWLSEYNIEHSYALTSAISHAGYNVLSLEYRRTGDVGGGWPGTYEDIVAGITVAGEEAKQAVNTRSVVLVGHSAGGHLAVLAGQNMKVAGVIGLAAITDIEEYAKGKNSCETATPAFMGGSPQQRPQEYDKANPAKHKMRSKTVLLHGDQDAIVALSHAQLTGAESHIEKGAGHFDWVHPGSPAFAHLLATLSAMSAM